MHFTSPCLTPLYLLHALSFGLLLLLPRRQSLLCTDNMCPQPIIEGFLDKCSLYIKPLLETVLGR